MGELIVWKWSQRTEMAALPMHPGAQELPVRNMTTRHTSHYKFDCSAYKREILHKEGLYSLTVTPTINLAELKALIYGLR